MKLEYTLTLADAKAAERLHIRQRLGRRIGYGFLYLGMPVLATFSLIGFYAFDIGAKRDFALGYSVIVVILISQAIFIPVERSKRLNRLIKPKTAMGELTPARSIEINEEKISAEIPFMAKTDLTWSAIAQVIQDENVTLVYVNDKDFILVPTRAFTSFQRTELNDLVARRITPRKP